MRPLIGLALLLGLALVLRYAALLLGAPLARRIRQRAHSRFTDVVMADAALRRMAKALPYLLIHAGIADVPYLHAGVVTVIANVSLAMIVIQMVRALWPCLTPCCCCKARTLA